MGMKGRREQMHRLPERDEGFLDELDDGGSGPRSARPPGPRRTWSGPGEPPRTPASCASCLLAPLALVFASAGVWFLLHLLMPSPRPTYLVRIPGWVALLGVLAGFTGAVVLWRVLHRMLRSEFEQRADDGPEPSFARAMDPGSLPPTPSSPLDGPGDDD